MDDISKTDRERRAAKIARNPSKYKVCATCDSIALAMVAICPNCHGYRFIEDRESVILQAQELGQREPQSVLWDDLEPS